MIDPSFALYALINTIFIVLVSPLFMGLAKIAKAKSQGRCGPKLFQQYYNLKKLLKKERVYSSSSSAITRTTPYISVAVMAVASLCIPLAFVPAQSEGIGNIILFLYLLAFARFFMALGGLDSGTTFG